MSDFKPFPPSEERILRLRQSGIIPTTRFLLVCGLFLGLLVFSRLFLSAQFLKFQSLSASLWSGGPMQFEFLKFTLVCLFQLLLCISPSVFLVGLLRSKFLFSPGLTAPNFKRLFGGAYKIPRESTLLDLFALGVCLSVLWLCLSKTNSTVLPLNFDLQSALSESLIFSTSVVEDLLWAALLLSALLSIIGQFVSVMMFRVKYSMTRAEVEAERLEGQGARDTTGDSYQGE